MKLSVSKKRMKMMMMGTNRTCQVVDEGNFNFPLPQSCTGHVCSARQSELERWCGGRGGLSRQLHVQATGRQAQVWFGMAWRVIAF